MIKRSKMIAGVLLVTMLLSGIPEGFGTVTTVYADEPVATVEKTEEPESGEQNPEDDDLDEANPSEEEKKIIDEKSSAAVEESDKKEDVPDEQKDDHPAFTQSKTVNGVKVTVEADAGVFPEGAKLSVTSVSSSETEKEVDKERDDKNVAVSYTFDIKVLDEEDNELQPAEDQNVKVSFRTAEVADPNLEVSVFHISEKEGAEELDVDVSGQTAVAESDGFSYYTVEFTYNDLQYVLGGDESVALSEILSKVGLVGEAMEVTVSNPELFSASKENGRWIITAHKAFSSDEWMKVTIGDITYEITVTDDPATSGTCGDSLTWTFDYISTTLTISGTGAMYDYNDSNNSPWSNLGSAIDSVIINSGVTSIGTSAFESCGELASVTIPSSVTSIGTSAFESCSHLASVTIPSSVTSIGQEAFKSCWGLTSIVIPSSVTSIGNNAFQDCIALSTVYYCGNADLSGIFPSGVNVYNTFTVSSVGDREYNGSAYNPTPTVQCRTTLTKDTDYTLTYEKYTGSTWNTVTNVIDAGTYRVKVTGKTGSDYANFTAYSNAFSIAQKNVTITAASGEKTYDGTPLTNSQVTVTGGSLCSGDSLTASATGSATNVADTATGNNPIAAGYSIMNGSTDVTGNYAITTVAGTLTITPKTVTITAQDKAFTYDGTSHSWPNYDVTGLVGSDAITAMVTGSISSASQSPVANVVASYQFTAGTAGNYSVTTRNGQLTMTGNPAPINPTPINPAPINPTPINPTPKHDDDNSHHEDSSSSSQTNNTRVPDGCDELRLMFSSAIATAKVTGTPQTVYWNKGTSLPYDAMKTLHDNPMITLVFTYKYLGMDFAAVIPGSAAYATPSIQWYGPIYLYLLYGNTKVPAATGTYTIKPGDTLSGIAMKLNTTIQHLKNVNSIRNINEIKTGMALKY